ncbi:5-formyltetrahydrofolate cyclo-ligase [Halotalea alkalilenta]|uniref:5-formyltetrahydrofolate cyclo-ligase n=1 Tax=Halotalea alkalilenta TaxID=376489 RepID=UPI0009EF5E21|nr:5-formyltetrahydrofolate cyclo-ligase [Halotalea alkalilenta]
MLSRHSRRARHPFTASFLFTPPPLPLVADRAPVPAPLPFDADRRQLRRRLRARRRSLGAQAQRIAARRLARRLLAEPRLRHVRHLALYLPSDGEIDPTPLIALLARRGVRIYLPVLRPLVENRLWFVRLTRRTRLAPNRFGIAEPQTRASAHPARRLPAWALGAVLLPLVGFDARGERLGMGGGFYDRSLGFVRRGVGRRPRLYGLAHALQQVERLPVAPWDVPLDAVVSDAGRVVPSHRMKPETARNDDRNAKRAGG